MKLNEAKIKKKRHKSLDPWRLYVPDWSRTSGLLLRRQSLYPTELQELIYIITVLCNRYNQIIQFWNSQLVYYIFTEFASIVSAPDARRRFPGLPCPCNFHR